MSHLIIEQGKGIGDEVLVPPGGMKFGRSPANDLVLEDERVMPFQGRFFFKSDGTLWVTDFSAEEKTTVDGDPVDERALKIGALVQVGHSAFRVIRTSAVAEAELGEEKIDLGFHDTGADAAGKKEAGKGSSLLLRLLQAVVVLLLLAAVAVIAPQLTKGSAGKGSGFSGDGALALQYECVKGSRNNIFRYELELTRDGVATIQMDDLGTQRHVENSVKVDAKAIKTLSRRLAGSGIFEEVAGSPVRVKDRYELVDLALSFNGEFNHVRLLNREAPASVKQAVSLLEDFVFSELEVPFTYMEDSQTLTLRAEEAFKRAETFYEERDVRVSNLAKAVAGFKEAMIYLETLEPRPELYRRAVVKLETAKAKQDERYKDYMFNADRAMSLNDWSEAAENLRILAELVPDRKDKRHEVIKAKQMTVEDKLR